MSRGLTRKQVLGEYRTGEIVAAAKQVIAAKGFAAATMDEIAEAAQIAKGTIYLYFKSKDQLFQAVAGESLARLIARIRQIHHGGGSPTEKLVAVLKVMLETLEAEQALFRVYSTEFPCLIRPADRESRSVADIDREFIEALAEVVAEGKDAGDFNIPDPRKAAYLLRGMARGLAIAKMVDGSEESLVNSLSWLADFTLRGMAGVSGEKRGEGP